MIKQITIKGTLFIFLLFCNLYGSYAQEVEMADDFRGEGKIYVVVAVVLVILIGIFFTLFRIEKKLNKFEKEHQNKE